MKKFRLLLIVIIGLCTHLSFGQTFTITGPSQVCPGSTYTFEMENSSGGLLLGSYSWKLDGVVLSGDSWTKQITIPANGGFAITDAHLHPLRESQLPRQNK